MNPFLITSYKEPKFFCNREKELNRIISAVINNRNIVLNSIRRMGKTGLIRHLFHQLKTADENYLFYIDIDQTNNINEFLNKLINSLLREQKKNLYEKVLDFIKQFRPILTFDPLTGQPEVEIKKSSLQQDETSIESVLGYLERLDKQVIIAIDEFQRITDYPEKRVEAFLRSYIQHLKNVNFIFSGSSTHLLQSMFSDYSRAFYQSAEILNLERLNRKTYAEFIRDQFVLTGKKIGMATVKSGLDWADNHTFYVQFLFNMVWGTGINSINDETVAEVQNEIIASRDSLYCNYRNLLTDKQYSLLRAIAIEDGVSKPNAGEFIKKYDLGTASTVNSALKTLVAKELVYHESGLYKLYDVFQKKWFQQPN